MVIETILTPTLLFKSGAEVAETKKEVAKKVVEKPSPGIERITVEERKVG